MTLAAGQVVATSEGRKGLVWGQYGRYAIVLQIIRAKPRHRGDILIAGRIHWHDAEAATPGYIAAAKPRLVPPAMLRVVGRADDSLMADCLKAQIRELEADDAPLSESRAEVKDLMAEAQGVRCHGWIHPRPMAE